MNTSVLQYKERSIMFNFKKNERYAAIAAYALLVIVASALIIMAVINYRAVFDAVSKALSILAPFTYGFIIAYLCNPILNFYERNILRFKEGSLKRALSLILTTVTALAFLAVIAYAVIPQTVSSVNDFVGHVNGYVTNIQVIVDEFTVKYSPLLFNKDYSTFTELLADHDITVNIKEIVLNSVSFLGQRFNDIVSIGGRLVGEILNILMGIFVAYYFLATKEKICAQAKKLLAAAVSRRAYLNTIRLARYTHRTFGGFLVGKIIDSLIIGLLSFIVLWILKIPYYPLLAVIIGVTNIVPTFGPIIGGVIGSLIVVISSPEHLIVFIILVLLIQQLDGNIIGPKILGDSIGIGALWVVIAVVVFGGFFGFGGMIIGVPAVAVMYALVKQHSERRLRIKNMPRSTEFYKTDPPKENDIDPHLILIDRDTPVPDLTADMDVATSGRAAKITLIQKIKNNINSKNKKGEKK